MSSCFAAVRPRLASDASPFMRSEVISGLVNEHFAELRALAVANARPWREVL